LVEHACAVAGLQAGDRVLEASLGHPVRSSIAALLVTARRC
jgi:hypothetical protein